MLYYRYRPMNSLTIKELIYDELYFSYPGELNDPLDGLITYEFPEDYPKWKRLLDYAWKDIPIDTTNIAEEFTKKSPVSVRKVASSEEFALETITSGINNSEKHLIFILARKLRDYISAYIPGEGCSVSFSRVYDNALMWSHYTGKHEGFCLIFRSIDGCINQAPSIAKTSITTSSHSSTSITRNFRLHDVSYGANFKSLDGFVLFPVGVYGRDFNQEERDNYWKSVESAYLNKSACWDYEEESRLYIPAGSVLTSDDMLSPLDRIFHYDNSQIAGVIYGMRMSESNKNLVREILLRKSEDRFKDDQNDMYLFDIVAFEASFDDSRHAVAIKPTEIYDCGNAIDRFNPNFLSKFTSWEKGEALHIRSTEKGRGASRVILD